MSLYRKPPETGPYYISISIPADVRWYYENQPQKKLALNTKDINEARLRGAEITLRFEHEFNYARTQISAKNLSPDEKKKYYDNRDHRFKQIMFIITQYSNVHELRKELLDDVVYHAQLATRTDGWLTAELYHELFGENDPNRPPDYKIKFKKPGDSVQDPIRLSAAIQSYLGSYSKKEKREMLEGLRVSLGLFLSIVGDKFVNELTQSDLIRFFDTVYLLPPDWKKISDAQGIPVAEVASQNTGRTLSRSTIVNKYRSAVVGFVDYGQGQLQDFGFNQNLKPEKIMMKQPDDADVVGRQRALTVAEFDTLISAIKNEWSSPQDTQKVWFVLLGMLTGARIREICQLHPVHDFHIDTTSGTHFFEITNKTPAGPGIVKSLKNKSSLRTVPIHSKLIDLGFLDYVEACRAANLGQLFPVFPTQGGNASAGATKRFAQFVEKIGIRDETPGAQITGYHCLRSTFIHTADNQTTADGGVKQINVSSITGHKAKYVSAVYGNYAGKSKIAIQKIILEEIVWPFDLSKLPKPPTPDFAPKLSKRAEALMKRPIR